LTNATKRRHAALRLDQALIEQWVESSARVLDLGCGDGALLERLIADKHVVGRGVELSQEMVQRCVERGVPVYHGDVLEGLAAYEDGSFDYVILSQTIQETYRPREVIAEMLRVGKRAIVSFPNFAHWWVRFQIFFMGRMPRSRLLPHAWYDSPNIHVVTVKDFRRFCKEEHIRIVREVYLTAGNRSVPALGANFLAGVGIFMVMRDEG